jgi:hypothetical protein
MIQTSESHGTRPIRCHSSLPVGVRESRSSIYIRFAMVRDHIPSSVLSCPFGAMDLRGALLPRAARRGFAATLCPGLICHYPFGALGRSHRVGRAPKKPPRPEETAMPQRNGSASRNRHTPKERIGLHLAIRRFSFATLFCGRLLHDGGYPPAPPGDVWNRLQPATRFSTARSAPTVE